MIMTRNDYNYGVRIEITSEEFLDKGGQAILKEVVSTVSKELSKMVLDKIKGNALIWKRRSKKIAIAVVVLLVVIKFYLIQ